mmetsp:Transcript_14698/g.30423  ORF Transcript_14698/g.30423 Transcript_14698/m.30423 type:complete len:404 (+) Transcript_14698:11-1222(+)
MAELPAVVETSSVEKIKKDDGTKMINNFEVIKVLGKGAFGKVKLCKDTNDGQLYAIKIMDKMMLKKKRQGMSNMLESVKKEIAIMKKLNHKNCVRMYEVIDDPSQSKLYLRLENVEGGQCMPSDNGTTPLDHATAQRYFVDMMNGLEYLHHNRVLHRDIKPENLLVTKEGSLKLADFGVSQFIEDGDDLISKSAGTPAFIPPECCQTGPFRGKLADIWSAGVSLFFFYHGSCPFVCGNMMQLYEMIQNDPIVYDKSLPPEVLDILQGILNKDPAQRFDMGRIKAHPYFASAPGAAATQDMGEPITVTEDEVQNAMTLTDKVVLMVRISQVMKNRLKNVREAIALRNKAKEEGREVSELSAEMGAASLTSPPASPSAELVPENDEDEVPRAAGGEDPKAGCNQQ